MDSEYEAWNERIEIHYNSDVYVVVVYKEHLCDDDILDIEFAIRAVTNAVERSSPRRRSHSQAELAVL